MELERSRQKFQKETKTGALL